jgi:hypothetical protein
MMMKTAEEILGKTINWKIFTSKYEQTAKLILEAMKEYASQETESAINGQWIDVKERLPEINIPVLIFTNTGVLSVCYLNKRGVIWINCIHPQFAYDVRPENVNYIHPTHWMPLPNKPKP